MKLVFVGVSHFGHRCLQIACSWCRRCTNDVFALHASPDLVREDGDE